MCKLVPRYDVSNWSVFVYVPVRRRDDVTARSRTLILVNKIDQFYLGTRQYVSSASPVVQPH